MINNQIISSFWERAHLSKPEDRFVISTIEAKQLIMICRNDIYTEIDLEFEPIKKKAENLYNDFASLINDSLIKSKNKNTYTYESFFEKYINLQTQIINLYIESNAGDGLIEEANSCIQILTEAFIK